MVDLKTATYDLSKFPDVYEPNEDSFFFLDVLEADLAYLAELKPTFVAEIGSGSGVLVTTLAKALPHCHFLATDINPAACEATSYTAKLNDVSVECARANLLSTFKCELFDVVLFNPPYVVTDSSELKGSGVNRSWAGGRNGREVIDVLLREVSGYLRRGGLFYLLALKENGPHEIVDSLIGDGFALLAITERKIPGEHLYVIKFMRS